MKIGEIFTLQMGKTPSRDNLAYWNGTNRWCSIADLSNCEKYIFETKEYITDKAIEESGIRPVPPNTVIMSFKLSIGKTAITKEHIYTNEAIMAFISNGKIAVEPDYLYYYFSNRNWMVGTNKAVMGATLNKATISEMNIALPCMNEQKAIANKLDKIDGIIALRKKQLQKLDDLVKARFVEMFGDPATNDKGFETVLGSNAFKLSNGKFVPESKRLDTGIPVYGGNGISWYTDEVLHAADTIVVGRVGFQSGNVHLVKGPLWISDNAMYISDIWDSGIDLCFLYQVMEHIDFTRFQDAGDLKKITQKPFMMMQYIKPPIDMQLNYIAFVSQVDKSKLFIQQGLEKLETLKKSLMQQYFG